MYNNLPECFYSITSPSRRKNIIKNSYFLSCFSLSTLSFKCVQLRDDQTSSRIDQMEAFSQHIRTNETFVF